MILTVNALIWANPLSQWNQARSSSTLSFNLERNQRISSSWLISKLINAKINRIFSKCKSMLSAAKLIMETLIKEGHSLTWQGNSSTQSYSALISSSTSFWSSYVLRIAHILTISSKKIITRPNLGCSLVITPIILVTHQMMEVNLTRDV